MNKATIMAETIAFGCLHSVHILESVSQTYILPSTNKPKYGVAKVYDGYRVFFDIAPGSEFTHLDFLVNIALNYFKAHNKLISQEDLVTEIQVQSLRINEIVIKESALKWIASDDYKELVVTDLTKDYVYSFYKIYAGQNATIEMAQHIDDNATICRSPDYGPFIRYLEKINTCQVETNVQTKSQQFDSFETWIKNRPPMVRTMYKFIDEKLEGGLAKDTVTVIQAETNLGKTLIKLCIGSRMAKFGSHGIFLTYEIGQEATLQKYYASLTGIPTSKIPDNLPKIKDALTKCKGDLTVKYFPDGTSTSAISAYLDAYQDEFNRKPDFLIVDYIGCLTSVLSGKESNSYERYGNVISDLKRIAGEYQVPILTSVQSNRAGYGKTEGSLATMSDSMKIAQKADNIFNLTLVKDLSTGKRIVELKLNKSRQSPYNGATELFVFDKACQRMHEGLSNNLTESELMEYGGVIQTQPTQITPKATRKKDPFKAETYKTDEELGKTL